MTDIEVAIQLSRLKIEGNKVLGGAAPSMEASELRGMAIEALEEIQRYRLGIAKVEAKYKDLEVDAIKKVGIGWVRPDILATIQLMDSSSAGMLLAGRLLVLRMAGLVHDYRTVTKVPGIEGEPPPED